MAEPIQANMQEFMMNLMGRMVQATEAATVAAQQAATVTGTFEESTPVVAEVGFK